MGGHSSGGLFPGTMGDMHADGDDGGKMHLGPDGNVVEKLESAAAPPSTSTTRERLLAEASTDQAKRVVSELYREGAEVGDGGTADAIREQIRTGKLVGGRDHVEKGRQRLRQIERILARNPSHPDRALLERLRDDLKDALGGA